MAEDYYKTLEVRPTASDEEIKKAYRHTVRRCHPDLHPGDAEARAKFQQVQTAFEVLINPQRRRAYNRSSASFDTTRTSPFRPPASSTPENSYASITRFATIQVSEPVIGLAVTTGLGMSLHYLALINRLLGAGGGTAAGGDLPMPAVFTGGLGVFLSLVSCILGLIVIAGAIQMKNLEHYRLAVTAAILATFCCLSPWFLPGLPFGIWALVVLGNQQVRNAFWS